MERKEIITNYKSIDYEGLKLDQSLFDSDDYKNNESFSKEGFICFEDIYFGLISLN